jgi:hypothetical protein
LSFPQSLQWFVSSESWDASAILDVLWQRRLMVGTGGTVVTGHDFVTCMPRYTKIHRTGLKAQCNRPERLGPL